MPLGGAPRSMKMSRWEARSVRRRLRPKDDRRSEIGSHIRNLFSREVPIGEESTSGGADVADKGKDPLQAEHK